MAVERLFDRETWLPLLSNDQYHGIPIPFLVLKSVRLPRF